MKNETKAKYGEVSITLDAIASVAGEAATMCYGVIGLAPRPSFIDRLPEQIQEGLKKEDYAKGIYAIKTPKGYDVSLYLYVAYGVKLTEVLTEVQKNVRYVLEKKFQMKFNSVNVYVMDVKDAE